MNPSKIINYVPRRLNPIGHNGVRFYDQINTRSSFTLYSYDAPLVAIGSSEYLLNFDNSLSYCREINYLLNFIIIFGMRHFQSIMNKTQNFDLKLNICLNRSKLLIENKSIFKHYL